MRKKRIDEAENDETGQVLLGRLAGQVSVSANHEWPQAGMRFGVSLQRGEVQVWRQELLSLVEAAPHPAWGPAHLRRVYAMTLDLAGEEGLAVDEEAVFAAAHLHDLGALPPYRQSGIDHAARSAVLAGEILPPLGFPVAKLELVQEVIRRHMFTADTGPSPEAVLLHDADTLDFLGAIGLARLLSIVGLDDWTPDLPTAIALCRRFCRELPDRLSSRAAREVGRARQREMEAFLASLDAETLDPETI